jgi:hypothetical protein
MIGQSTLDETIQTPRQIQIPSLIITNKNQVKKHMSKFIMSSVYYRIFPVFLWSEKKKNISVALVGFEKKKDGRVLERAWVRVGESVRAR